MTAADRELFELAAKAARLHLVWNKAWGWYVATNCDSINPPKARWNPRDDGDDALRLAVRLELDIRHTPDTTSVFRHQTHLASEHHGEPVARTCLAILRAAAEIGRALP